ncbi:APC family permease [Xanthomonas oryzae]|nr:APC family permease [Xanthomonas oryzae]QBN93534.1 APC family permease [Xanthomonas oryzae pv. oryzae]QBN97423.1 APC family permease [Xanthomonas oryzae pv. oryzae]QIF22815.1 APC family permease [Xanthomonas oryzae pv. oryzae]RBC64035.1 APC family permease [Xanthomonas oryzae pv. oryzae]RBD18745.1 APC family permease [Xanthomonas oryzae pv. oryzae]
MSEHALRRDVGPFALMLTGLGSIIGSGWLFGAWRAAGLAGPDAVWAWVLGAAIITTIAVSYAELGAMFPESGGMVRYSHYSHGSLVGFIAGWANWIAIVSVIPVEAEASVQYMASWPWAWAQGLYAQAPGGAGELSVPGLLISAVLVLVYFLLNFWSVKLFARSNTLITVFKLAVPAATGVALIASGFHSENFSVGVHGDAQVLDLAAVLTAVATAGIVFSFNGFQSPVNLAGEARNPGRSIPFAVLGSIALATVVYVILQVAYIGAVPPDLLAKAGWHGIDFRSPFAELAIIVNLQWLAMLLYIDAFVSPSGTGITYTATTARMVYGMEKNGTMPAALGKLHPVWGVPRMAMFFNLAVSFVFLFFFRGWGTLAAVISVATIISYLTGPISAMALRRHAPELHRPLRIAALPLLAGVAFVMATELLYWARWPLTGEIILLIVVALPVYCYYQARQGWRDLRRNLKGAAWMICYLPMIALLSWAGSSKFGGHGYLSYGTDLAMVAAVGVVFYIWGVRSGWRTPSVEKPVAQA